jgi:ribosomal protein L24
VWKQLQELAKNNGGKVPEVLRRNNLIEVKNGNYKGVWRVVSITNNTTNGILLEIISPSYVKKPSKENVRLNTLLINGLRIIEANFTCV